jgi:hypothetical protein
MIVNTPIATTEANGYDIAANTAGTNTTAAIGLFVPPSADIKSTIRIRSSALQPRKNTSHQPLSTIRSAGSLEATSPPSVPAASRAPNSTRPGCRHVSAT